MRILIACLALLLASIPVHAEMVVKPVDYRVGDVELAGHVVYDDASKQARPGLVMVPNWMGVNDSAVEKAKAMAGSDYVVFVADMYGKGVRPKDATEARAQVTALYGDLPALRARINAAVDALKAQAGHAPLQTGKVGAFGFCFGGSTVLELARSGTELAGVVSLHGGLDSPAPAAAASVKTPILVLNGAEDRGTTAENIAAFDAEMDAAGADWTFVNFSGAVHCFAEADANRPPGCVYNERAAKAAWRMMRGFFSEAFAAPAKG
ncbi:MAG: dienelactone hydrolase family protein [Gammaproteobacteria bacterium]|nr:MAG: dienelactone hydrolase family protein [Gammaproteobacteria bacterium]